jgi:hypothetical protein
LLETSEQQLIERLAATARCRPEVGQLAEDWAGVAAAQYSALTARLTEQGEGKALGILLNVAAVNQIILEPRVLAQSLKALDDISDFLFPYRFQDESAIAPLLEVALAPDMSWDRQALAAHLAAELTLKFNQARQPVKKVLWQLSKEILSGQAQAMVHVALVSLDKEAASENKHLRISEREILKELPKQRPPVIIGGDYTVRRPVPKLGRNDPCHCGSGKKYKKCCYEPDQQLLRDASGYAGLTRTQLRSDPALVADTAPIERMRIHELKQLKPFTLNDEQLLAAYLRTEFTGMLELGFDLLFELKQRPGQESLAVMHMKDLFDAALRERNRELADKLTRQIPAAELYENGVQRLHHELLVDKERFDDLEALCREALTSAQAQRDYLLLELSYAFSDQMPAMSVVFGRAAILSEPERVFDNEVLFDSIEKNRIALDLEPWGDPLEEYLDWLNQRRREESRDRDKDKKIEELHLQLEEARGKSDVAMQDLRRKERELTDLEKALKKMSSSAPSFPEKLSVAKAVEPPGDFPAAPDAESRQQVAALRKKIELLKDEIRSQQGARQQLRRQLQEANQKLSHQETGGKEQPAFPAGEEEGEPAGQMPKKIQIPEFSAAFRKSCEHLPQPVVAKALLAAAGFAARDEAVLRQAAALEQLPGYFRVRIGIHHRLLLRQLAGESLQIVDIIPRQSLETWIRQQAT